MRPSTIRVFIISAAFVFSAQVGQVLASSAERGLEFVATNCAKCHAIGADDESPLTIAPPFRMLHENYPVEDLEEALAEGIVTGHPEMPEFQLDGEQIADLITYLKTLE
jgi:cytochrome c